MSDGGQADGGQPSARELTYPLRTAARLTGLSPELLRAWERRYGVVQPLRTQGGTRRYRASDLERLRLVKAAVDAGHRVGRVAHLSIEELTALAAPETPVSLATRLEPILEALEQLNAAEAQRLVGLQIAALGPARFARECAVPLVHEIGDRWAAGRLSIPAEHLATGVLRSMLGSALQPSEASLRGPRIVFAAPSGERHELGLLMAALTAMGAGANPYYLGVEVPVEDLLSSVELVRADVLALSIVTVPTESAARALSALRGGLPENVLLWIGGSGSGALTLPEGCERIESLDELERRVTLLGLPSSPTV